MNWDAIGVIAEVLRAVAVLVTPVSFSLQIHPSNKLAGADANSNILGALPGNSADYEMRESNPETDIGKSETPLGI
jgi:hypothetical protein